MNVEIDLVLILHFIEIFLGNYNAKNRKRILRNYRELGYIMSVKIYFLNSHLDQFSRNLGDVTIFQA